MKRAKQSANYKAKPTIEASEKILSDDDRKKIYLKADYKKYTVILLIITLFAVGIFVFFDYFTLKNLFFFKGIGSDGINIELPAAIHESQLLEGSFSEKWSFYQGMGNVYYKAIPVEPVGTLAYLFDYLGYKTFGDDFLVFGRFLKLFIFNFLLSGIIFYYFLRTVSFNNFSAFIGAVIVTFSGYMVLASSWGISGHIFRAVFLLFAFEQLFVKKRWYFFPFAVVYISGNIFILYIYSLFLLTYSLFRFFTTEKANLKSYFLLTGKMILLGFIGLLMNSVNVWRNFQVLFFSPRVSGNSSLSDKLVSGTTGIDYSNHNSTAVLRFFSNDILGSGLDFKGWYNYFEAPAFYIGIFSLIVFSQIFTQLKRRNAIIFSVFAVFWLLTIFVPQIRYAILLYTGDYYRFGFDFFIPFILIFAAIFSINNISDGFKVNYKILAFTAVSLIILLYFPYKSVYEGYIDKSIQKTATLLIVLYSGIIVLMSVNQYKNIAKILLLATVILEVSYFSYKSYENRTPLTKKEYAANMGGYKDGTRRAVKYLKNIDPKNFFRTSKDYSSGNAIHASLNDAMAQGYYGTARYSSFTQINYVRFLEETGIIPKGDETSTRWVTGLRNYPLLLTFANVKYQLSKSENPEFSRFGFKLIKEQAGIKILKNEFYLPFGFTYDKYINFDYFEQLKKYKITQFSIQNISLELQRLIPQNKVNELIQSVQPIVNKEFDSDSSFYAALKNVLTFKDFQERKFTFIRHSTQNFRNQVALLTCFVNEEGENFIDTSGFKKLNVKDTSVFVGAQYFNFNLYQKLVNELKTDTFVIESFSQSKISGTVNLSQKKLLFFTIPFDKGWKIKVNGKKDVLKRVNIGFSGIKLNKGNYKIELYYEPDYYKPSIIITIVSNLTFWGVLIFYFIRKKRKHKKIQHD